MRVFRGRGGQFSTIAPCVITLPTSAHVSSPQRPMSHAFCDLAGGRCAGRHPPGRGAGPGAALAIPGHLRGCRAGRGGGGAAAAWRGRARARHRWGRQREWGAGEPAVGRHAVGGWSVVWRRGRCPLLHAHPGCATPPPASSPYRACRQLPHRASRQRRRAPASLQPVGRSCTPPPAAA